MPPEVWDAAQQAVEDCDVFIIAGTSGVVYPAAGLAEMARRKHKTVVQINPASTAQDRYADHVLTGPSGVCLPALLAATWPGRE